MDDDFLYRKKYSVYFSEFMLVGSSLGFFSSQSIRSPVKLTYIIMVLQNSFRPYAARKGIKKYEEKKSDAH